MRSDAKDLLEKDKTAKEFCEDAKQMESKDKEKAFKIYVEAM